jgi:hypothetical protein
MEAKRILDRAGANLLGIVFNNVSQLEHKHYHMIPQETYRAEKPVRPRTNDASFVDMRPNGTQDTWVSNVSDAHPSPEENNTNTPRTNS